MRFDINLFDAVLIGAEQETDRIRYFGERDVVGTRVFDRHILRILGTCRTDHRRQTRDEIARDAIMGLLR